MEELLPDPDHAALSVAELFQPSPFSILSGEIMTNHRRRSLLKLPLFCAPAMAGFAAFAQKPTSIIVPVPPGGGMDGTARLVAERTRHQLGTMLVENKAGAAMRIGLQAVRGAEPDGTTLLYSHLAPFTIYPFLYKKLGYDAERDLIPIAQTCSFEYALAVPGNSPISSLAEYMEAVRRDPRYGLYAVPAAGTSSHFAGAALARASGLEMKHVAYKGSAPALQDLIGGHVLASISVLGDFLQYRASSKVKVLGTTGARRSPFTPDVPTFTEFGLKGMALSEAFGFFAPAKTPAATIERISGAVLAAVQEPDFSRKVEELGYTSAPLGPSQFAGRIKADRDAWGPIVKATGFTLDE
jgi:tripartite-type tricarboxylate transporter receptor subunit TctC